MSAMITAAVALTVATGYSIYSGERAAKKQNEALQQQQQANQEAKAAATKQENTLFPFNHPLPLQYEKHHPHHPPRLPSQQPHMDRQP